MYKANKKIAFLMLLCGGGLLAVNLQWVTLSWGVIWTFCPMLYGLSMYYEYYKSHNKDLLTLATFLTTVGIFFFINALEIGLQWPAELPWWPVLPFFWGVGMLVTYLTDRKDIYLFFYSVVIMCVSIMLICGSNIHEKEYLKYWPVILIIIGIIIFFRNKKVNPEQGGSNG
jgi:hypothetical protein